MKRKMKRKKAKPLKCWAIVHRDNPELSRDWIFDYKEAAVSYAIRYRFPVDSYSFVRVEVREI